MRTSLTKQTIIETARLRIRCYRDDDVAALVALAGSWEVVQWVGLMPSPYTDKDGRDWIETVKADHATGRPRRFSNHLRSRLIGGNQFGRRYLCDNHHYTTETADDADSIEPTSQRMLCGIIRSCRRRRAANSTCRTQD